MAPASLTAGLRCAAPWLSGNHNAHQHDVYSETDRVSWPRKYTHAQEVSQSHEKEVVGTGPRGCSRDRWTSGWCDCSLSRRGKRGELESGVEQMFWPVRVSCSTEATSGAAVSVRNTHTRDFRREPGAGQLPWQLRHACVMFQLTHNNQHQIIDWFIPRNAETLCLFYEWSKNVNKLQQNYTVNQRFSTLSKKNNESDYGANDAILQLCFDVIWFYTVKVWCF